MEPFMMTNNVHLCYKKWNKKIQIISSGRLSYEWINWRSVIVAQFAPDVELVPLLHRLKNIKIIRKYILKIN